MEMKRPVKLFSFLLGITLFVSSCDDNSSPPTSAATSSSEQPAPGPVTRELTSDELAELAKRGYDTSLLQGQKLTFYPKGQTPQQHNRQLR
jgi:hypothetical protein